MRIHFFLHASFEMPGNLVQLASERGHAVSFTRFYLDDDFPETGDLDMLVIMGGPMGIYEEERFPYLREEKDFITKAITDDKMVLGICLGAQLIADVLGADVYPNGRNEIGWFPVVPDNSTDSDFLELFPREPLTAFHWHGDTFDLPDGAQRLFTSEATLNQGFIFGDRVMALQFHWEVTPENVRQLIDNNKDTLTGEFVQKPDDMLSPTGNFLSVKKLMEKTLDYFEERFRYTAG